MDEMKEQERLRVYRETREAFLAGELTNGAAARACWRPGGRWRRLA